MTTWEVNKIIDRKNGIELNKLKRNQSKNTFNDVSYFDFFLVGSSGEYLVLTKVRSFFIITL
jgi:hypothetical protein